MAKQSVKAPEPFVQQDKCAFFCVIGVFYIIYGGLVLSVLALAAEWIIKAFTTVDRTDPMVRAYEVIYFLSRVNSMEDVFTKRL